MFSTLTVTLVDLLWPLESVAVALIVWLPFETFVVFQFVEKEGPAPLMLAID